MEDRAPASAGNGTQEPRVKLGTLDIATLRNPEFAGWHTRQPTEEEALARMFDDIERSERDGDVGDLCVWCDRAAKDYCNGCKHARYCSRACQVADWPIHKKVCKDFAGAAADAKRPSPSHRRVLFFPMFNTKPQLHWTDEKKTAHGRWLELDHAERSAFSVLAGVAGVQDLTDSGVRTLLNLQHHLGGRRIGHALTAFSYCIVRPLHHPQLLNRSINALAKPGYLRPWAGPVIVFADVRRRGDSIPGEALDITPRDVNTVVRLLETPTCACVADPGRYLGGEVVAGLRINDIRTEINVALGVDCVFESTLVPRSPVECADHVIAIALLLGLRWYIRPANYYADEPGNTIWSDGTLRYLAYICDVQRTEDVPVEGGGEDGDSPPFCIVCDDGPFVAGVIVLHGSGNPIHMHHVLALGAYIDQVIFEKGMPSEAGFRSFWDDYKERMGDSVLGVPSPYEWEKEGIKDKLGAFEPKVVRQALVLRIEVVWQNLTGTIGS